MEMESKYVALGTFGTIRLRYPEARELEAKHLLSIRGYPEAVAGEPGEEDKGCS